MKKNRANDYESIDIVITRKKYPIIYENKVNELVANGDFNTRQEAEEYVEGMTIELELYYEKNKGLFGVEADAVECSTIYSPYTSEGMEEPDDE